jgi:DNA replication and repair protein RecF
MSAYTPEQIKINHAKHEKVGDLVGQLNVVIFSSVDVDMVKGEPSHRRRFMNLEISQVSPQYVYALGRYKRVLEQRNSVIKEAKVGKGNGKSIDVWDDQLAGYGSIMMEKRLVFIRRLSEMSEPIYDQLSGGRENLLISYEPSVKLNTPSSLEEIRDIFTRELQRSREHDLARGTTTKGPHRDDISFKINGLDIRNYGSQGQQRSAALSMKLAEIGIIEEMVGESPVTLLDDVGAELDEQRREQVFALTLGRCQILVTATSTSELPADAVRLSKVFNVTAGVVQRE